MSKINQLSEQYLSDQLAWLLNPKGSHDLGVRFLRSFVGIIARKRSGGSKYKRSSTTLKFKKRGTGVAASEFSLKNASPIRELYFSPIDDDKNSGVLFTDLAVVDLDSNENLIIIIENKLFGDNHKDQLANYRKRVSKKFKRCKVKEYVYLTLNGKPPIEHSESSARKKENSYWVNLSWIRDILPTLKRLQNGGASKKVKELIKLLSSIKDIQTTQNKNEILITRKTILNKVAKCLLEELNRLNGENSSYWKKSKTTKKEIQIQYTRHRARYVKIRLLDNLSITAQSFKGKKGQGPKHYLTLNLHPDQVLNFIDLFAREIYHIHFDDVMKYLSKKKKLTATRGEAKLEVHKLLLPLYRDYARLQLLSTLYA